MPDELQTALRRHPLADELIDGGVVHRSDEELLRLTLPMADLLLTAGRAGRRVVLLTPATTRLTDALANALLDARGVWLVEEGDGTAWDGRTGRVVGGAEEVLLPLGAGSTVAPAFAAGAHAEARQVLLSASVRHRRGTPPRVGMLLETVATAVGAPPVSYGPHEPTARGWDRDELTALVGALPTAPRLLVAGTASAPLSASLLLRPTDVGAEEVVDATIAVVGDDDLGARVARAFERVAAETFPLFAFVLVRPGRADLTRAPVLSFAPAPLAVVIGAPGVRDLGVDVDGLVSAFGAIPIGRPRVPGLLIPFSGAPLEWDRLDRLVRLLGSERVAAAFGRDLTTR